MALQPGTNKQVPDHSIYDAYDKQTYLGNQYQFSFGNTEITTTSEYPLLLLQNPAVATSSFPSAYQSLFINVRSLICLTASQTAVLRYYLGPTFAAAGTAQTAINLRQASTNTSIATLTSGPTVSVNGKLIGIQSSNPLVPDRRNDMVIIDPGKTLLVTVQTSSNTTYIASELGWYEL